MSRRSKDQDLIDDLERWINAPDKKTAETNGHATPKAPSGSPEVLDEIIIEKCRSAGNSAKFEALFDRGDVHAYHDGDDSRADNSLLSILAFWTQDVLQLERIFSESALGQREKWRRRDDYRKRTINKALSKVGEIYDWSRERPSREYNHHETPLGTLDDDYIQNEDDEAEEKLSNIVWFHELGKPKPRRFVIEKVARKGYPLVVYGAGGVAKSFAALAGGIAIAAGRDEWLGLKVLEHGTVLYLDFELDPDEQLARVHELCNALEIEVPKNLAYLSGRGMNRGLAFGQADDFSRKHKPVAVIVDSVGQAMVGDMDKNKDVTAFFRDYIEPFSNFDVTPILVDHEGKLQQGEKHKDKSVIGGVYKTNNARGVMQFILDEYDKDAHRMDIRVRIPKINFEPPEPFGISITFGDEKVSMETRILPDEELLDEERVPLRGRVLAALAHDELSVLDIVRITGAAEGSVRNTLSSLMREDLVCATASRPKLYYRTDGGTKQADKGTDFVTREEGRSQSHEYNHHQGSLGVYGDDDTRDEMQADASPNKSSQSGKAELQEDYATVAEFFARPPEWLRKQVEKYRENPKRHFRPLCVSIAAVVLGDGLRWEEVREEVERELVRNP